MSACPSCGSSDTYRHETPVNAGGGYSPALLPKLGASRFKTAQMYREVCKRCGLMSMRATQEARDQLPTAKGWKRI